MPVLATLLYLRRPMLKAKEIVGTPLPAGVELVPYRPGADESVLVRLLPATYEGTLDCPELSSVRRPIDVVASHRAAGAWTPELWWLIHVDGEAEGVALFNPIPEQDAVELVYFGLTPRVRGRGLGRRLLQHAFERFAHRGEHLITCACDERNAPAMRMYESLGMREAERRIALVRVIEERE
jgi:GNAT superfamily N-acetyltransferase